MYIIKIIFQILSFGKLVSAFLILASDVKKNFIFRRLEDSQNKKYLFTSLLVYFIPNKKLQYLQARFKCMQINNHTRLSIKILSERVKFILKPATILLIIESNERANNSN